jgi:hypothetical protein
VNRLRSFTGSGRSWPILLPALLTLMASAAAIIVGCAANEPFDPSTVPNQPPVVRLFVGPVNPDSLLNATSYYRRTFRWSGTDSDGWVREFYISVRTEADVPALWDTTTNTDTTMTFVPDDNGDAEATFLLVCRDDRGALSDTVVQFVPLKNFPPAVNFQTDFDPLRNLQREFRDAAGQVTLDGSAAADTVYYNWGPMNFRMFALDPDGSETMNDFYRYTLADGDSTFLANLVTFDEDDPAADPNVNWVKIPFNSSAEIKQFSIFVTDVAPGTARTLRISVKDEAFSDASFRYTWEVREPRGPALFIAEGLNQAQRLFYETILDAHYGVGGWDRCAFWIVGAPDTPSVLLESFRKFDAVIWVDAGSGSANIVRASALNGVLQQYMWPVPAGSADPGAVLFVSKGLVGQPNGLTPAFLQVVVGVSPTPAPAAPLYLPVGKVALHQSGALPDMATMRVAPAGGVGLLLKTAVDNEALYRMESCTCYGVPPRPSLPPYDPIIGVRVPKRATEALARFVGLSVQLDNFDAAQVSSVLGAILNTELGVDAP